MSCEQCTYRVTTLQFLLQSQIFPHTFNSSINIYETTGGTNIGLGVLLSEHLAMYFILWRNWQSIMRVNFEQYSGNVCHGSF